MMDLEYDQRIALQFAYFSVGEAFAGFYEPGVEPEYTQWFA